MLEQLIKEWRQQAGIKSGMRGYVFSMCADQLEEALKKLEKNKIENKNQSRLPNKISHQLQMERELRDGTLAEDKYF